MAFVATFDPTSVSDLEALLAAQAALTAKGMSPSEALKAALDVVLASKRKEAEAVDKASKLIEAFLNGKDGLDSEAVLKALRAYAMQGDVRIVHGEAGEIVVNHTRNAARSSEGTGESRIAGTKVYYVRTFEGAPPMAAFPTALHKTGTGVDASAGRHALIALGIKVKVGQGVNSMRELVSHGYRVYVYNPAPGKNGLGIAPKGWHQFRIIKGQGRFFTLKAGEATALKLPEKPFSESEANRLAEALGVVA